MFVCVCVCVVQMVKKIKRLYTQITKETRGVQCLVAEYNATQECPEENILTAEALDPSKLQLRLQLMGVQAMGTKVEERQEIIQAYLTLKRSCEEITLLREDVKNVVAYYEDLKTIVSCEISQLDLQLDSQSRGKMALLHCLLVNIKQKLKQGRITEELMENSSPLSPLILDDFSSDSDLLDCE